jgi:hypothetical protein
LRGAGRKHPTETVFPLALRLHVGRLGRLPAAWPARYRIGGSGQVHTRTQ